MTDDWISLERCQKSNKTGSKAGNFPFVAGRRASLSTFIYKMLLFCQFYAFHRLRQCDVEYAVLQCIEMQHILLFFKKNQQFIMYHEQTKI